MLRCPQCKAETDSIVIETRTLEDGKYLRRRRECRGCKYRATSYECFAEDTGELPPPRVRPNMPPRDDDFEIPSPEEDSKAPGVFYWEGEKVAVLLPTLQYQQLRLLAGKNRLETAVPVLRWREQDAAVFIPLDILHEMMRRAKLGMRDTAEQNMRGDP